MAFYSPFNQQQETIKKITQEADQTTIMFQQTSWAINTKLPITVQCL